MFWFLDQNNSFSTASRERLLEKPSDENGEPSCKTKTSGLSMVRLVLLTLSASLLFTAGAVLGTLLSSVTFNPMPEGEASQHQAITPAPVFPTQQVISQQDKLFAAAPTIESDNAWNSILPTIRGLITLDSPERFGLPPGMVGTKGEAIYGLTWTHQYHCLKMIRAEFWHLVRNQSDLVGVENTMQDAEGGHSAIDGDHLAPSHRLEHFVHCFDYLRQTMLCTMDMTIEFAAKNADTGEYENHIDGWGIPRTCRSQTAAFEWMKAHAVHV